MLHLENVTKQYSTGSKQVRALDGVSLSVEAGDFLGVVGRSGSGKSTLLNLLAGLDRPTAGSIWIDGRDLAKMDGNQLAEHRQRTVGVVFQFFYLVPVMSALDNVALAMAFAGLSRKERRERARDLLGQVGLGERADHLPSELSGGEQQRVAIARALANNPRFILADEPTGNLDSTTAEEILSIFETLHKQGRTIICVTHETDLIERLATRFITLKDGRLADSLSKAN
jgi:putative ABC transport system ATP-binding protein